MTIFSCPPVVLTANKCEFSSVGPVSAVGYATGSDSAVGSATGSDSATGSTSTTGSGSGSDNFIYQM